MAEQPETLLIERLEPEQGPAAPAPEFAPPPDPGQQRISARTLALGFHAGLVLAILCFAIAAGYLAVFLSHTTGALDAAMARPQSQAELLGLHMYVARVLLQSCGLTVGMAFGFLGFSLFLLGVSGNMDARASAGGAAIQVARISPGAFVMLCSAILVGLCATQDIDGRIAGGTGGASAGQAEADPYAIAGVDDETGTTTNAATIEPDAEAPDR